MGVDSEARHAGVKFEIYEPGECGWFDKGGGRTVRSCIGLVVSCIYSVFFNSGFSARDH